MRQARVLLFHSASCPLRPGPLLLAGSPARTCSRRCGIQTIAIGRGPRAGGVDDLLQSVVTRLSAPAVPLQQPAKVFW